MVNNKNLPWYLFSAVVTIAAIEFGQSINWKLESLTLLGLFPLLGLLAWSIMWTHYVVGANRILTKQPKNILYSKISGVIVLFLILLHPGLLAISLYQNTGSLPPTSFLSYVGSNMALAVIIAELALLSFITYEFLERAKNRPSFNRYWFWISLSQVVAMIFIFVHSLMLGRNLMSGWFQFYWIILGALLIPCFGLILRSEWNSARISKQT